MSFTQKAAAAAGSLAVLSMASQDAEATIVHVTGSPVTLDFTAPNGTEVDWDIDGLFGRDFYLRKDTFGSPTTQYLYLESRGANGLGIVNAESTDEDEALRLNSGFVVGPTLATGYFLGRNRPVTGRTLLYNEDSSASIGFAADAIGFTEGVPGFIGFAFDADGTTLYGWASITLDTNAPGSITVNEWAYEDSGTEIAVGDTGAAAIPEPHSLAMIAMGAAGVAAWRLRRKKQTIETEA